MRRKSDAIGRDLNLRSTDPETDKQTTLSHRASQFKFKLQSSSSTIVLNAKLL